MSKPFVDLIDTVGTNSHRVGSKVLLTVPADNDVANEYPYWQSSDTSLSYTTFLLYRDTGKEFLLVRRERRDDFDDSRASLLAAPYHWCRLDVKDDTVDHDVLYELLQDCARLVFDEYGNMYDFTQRESMQVCRDGRACPCYVYPSLLGEDYRLVLYNGYLTFSCHEDDFSQECVFSYPLERAEDATAIVADELRELSRIQYKDVQNLEKRTQ